MPTLTRRSRALLALPLFLLGCPPPEDEPPADTDAVDSEPAETDPVETDPQDTDAIETDDVDDSDDVDDTDDTDALDTDALDTDALDTDAPARTRVTVRAEARFNEPAVSHLVAFHDPDGEVVAIDVTDRRGRAGHDLPDGGAVTLELADRLLTIVGVEPGDDLDLDAPTTGSDLSPDRTDVTVPGAPGFAEYQVSTGCPSATHAFTDYEGGVLAAWHDSGCRTFDDRLDVLATLTVDGILAGYHHELGADPDGAVVFEAPWRVDWVEPGVTLTNPPSGTSLASAFVDLWRGHRSFGRFEALGAPSGIGQTAVLAPRIPRDFAERTYVAVQIFDTTYQRASGLVRGFVGPHPPDLAIDGSDLPVPAQGVTVDGADPARPVLTWTGGTPLDVTLLWIEYEASAGPATWELVLPGDPGSLRLPALPELLGHLEPLGPIHTVQVRRSSLIGVDPHDQLVRHEECIRHLEVGAIPDGAEQRVSLATID